MGNWKWIRSILSLSLPLLAKIFKNISMSWNFNVFPVMFWFVHEQCLQKYLSHLRFDKRNSLDGSEGGIGNGGCGRPLQPHRSLAAAVVSRAWNAIIGGIKCLWYTEYRYLRRNTPTVELYNSILYIHGENCLMRHQKGSRVLTVL